MLGIGIGTALLIGLLLWLDVRGLRAVRRLPRADAANRRAAIALCGAYIVVSVFGGVVIASLQLASQLTAEEAGRHAETSLSRRPVPSPASWPARHLLGEAPGAGRARAATHEQPGLPCQGQGLTGFDVLGSNLKGSKAPKRIRRKPGWRGLRR